MATALKTKHKTIEDHKEDAKLAHKMWLSKNPCYKSSDIAAAYNTNRKNMDKKIERWREKIPGWFEIRKTIKPKKKRAPKPKDDMNIQAVHEMWLSKDPVYTIYDIAKHENVNVKTMISRVHRWHKQFPNMFLSRPKSLFFNSKKSLNKARREAKLAHEMWMSGATYKQIAEAHGKKMSAIWIRIKRWRRLFPELFPKREGPDYEAEAAIAHEMWISKDPFYTNKEIADACGLTREAFNNKIGHWRKRLPSWFNPEDRIKPEVAKLLPAHIRKYQTAHRLWILGYRRDVVTKYMDCSKRLLGRLSRDYPQFFPKRPNNCYVLPLTWEHLVYASDLFNRGRSVEQISKMTGVSIEEVKNLPDLFPGLFVQNVVDSDNMTPLLQSCFDDVRQHGIPANNRVALKRKFYVRWLYINKVVPDIDELNQKMKRIDAKVDIAYVRSVAPTWRLIEEEMKKYDPDLVDKLRDAF